MVAASGLNNGNSCVVGLGGGASTILKRHLVRSGRCNGGDFQSLSLSFMFVFTLLYEFFYGKYIIAHECLS